MITNMPDSPDPNLDDNIEKIEPMINFAAKRLSKAQNFLDFAKKAEVLDGGEENIYTTIYDAIRISCEAILAIFGYRIKKSIQSHHYIVINTASQLTDGKLTNEFARIQKMRNKRNKLEYGDLDSISEQELIQAHLDANALIKEIHKLIDKNNHKQGLFN